MENIVVCSANERMTPQQYVLFSLILNTIDLRRRQSPESFDAYIFIRGKCLMLIYDVNLNSQFFYFIP